MKSIVLGVDGASYFLFEKWKNKLPNFEKITKNYSYGKLNSTFPPVTIPAWITAMTGKKPSELGFYDFQKIDFKKRSSTIIKYDDWSPAIWDELGDNLKKVCVINFPGTFPPTKVNGVMVSGFLSPSNKNITYPVNYERELKKYDYRIYPKYNPYLHSDLKYIDDVFDMTRNKIQLYNDLLEANEYDAYFFGLMILDWLQHYYWKDMDPDHPDNDLNSEFKNIVYSGYKLVDRFIGNITDTMNPEDYLVIFSDHGFGPLLGHFNVNTWLVLNGYLTSKRKITNAVNTGVKKIKPVFSSLIGRFTQIGNRIKYRDFFSKILPESMNLDDPFTQSIGRLNVNWSKTTAFGYGYYNTIYINTKDRGGPVDKEDYTLLLDEIVSNLIEYFHETGHKVKIKKTNPDGANSRIPDIVYLIDDGSFVQSNSFIADQIWSPSTEKTGDHRIDGIWMVVSQESSTNDTAEINQIAPTIAHIHKIEFPGRDELSIFSKT